MFADEDNKIELKEIINNTLPKEIVAFLNTDGGTVYIGISKNRTVIGVENIDDSLRAISDIITDQISPRCVSFVRPRREVIEGKNIIRIDVKKGNQLFYIKKYGMSENGCYIRIGTSCRSLLPEEIQDRFIRYGRHDPGHAPGPVGFCELGAARMRTARTHLCGKPPLSGQRHLQPHPQSGAGRDAAGSGR